MTSQLQPEVAVYGGTAAGVCAAVAAAEAGARTVLIAPGSHLGGMVSGGLGYTDVGDVRVLGGAAARFRNAVADHYGVSRGAYAGPDDLLNPTANDDVVALGCTTSIFGRFSGPGAGSTNIRSPSAWSSRRATLPCPFSRM